MNLVGFLRILAFALAALLLCTNAIALGLDAPGSVFVYSEDKTVKVTIRNDSGTERILSIDFSAPTSFEFANVPESIQAESTKIIYLKIKPNQELEGQTYESALRVRLGSETMQKKINLIFRSKQGEIPGNAGQGSQTTDLTGLFSLSSFQALFTLENALNLALIVIAAVLLVAFIARLVKRLEASK